MSDKEIRVHTDKRGKDHVDIYSADPRGEHESIHINVDTSTGKGSITDTTGGSKETTNTQCYLTTACMRHFGNNFEDDCYELTVLRWFRDNFVSKKDIVHYYKTAPIIVEAINKEEQSDVIYDYIYDNVVDYCVSQIEEGNYLEAYSRYKNTILSFEEQFARPLLENNFVKMLKK